MESKANSSAEHLAYKVLFARSPNGLALFSPDGEIQSANPAFLSSFGEATIDALRRLGVRLPFPDVFEGPASSHERGADTSHREICIQKSDGTLVSVSLSITVIRGEGGAPQVVLAQMQPRAEGHERSGGDGLARDVLDCMDARVIATDRVGRITFVNRAFEVAFGYGADELIGHFNAGIFHDPVEIIARAAVLSKELGIHVPAGFQALVARAVRGASDEQEWTYLRKDGSRVPVLLRRTARRDGAGEVVGFVGAGTDLSDRKRSEKELLRTMQAAEEAVRAKAVLAASMSHEIRTPLNGVLGTTDELLATSLSRDQQSLVETIRASADDLLASVGELLDFSEMEGGLMDLGSQRFDLRSCVHEAVTLLLPLAARKGLEIGAQVAPEVPEAILGDPARLRRVLTCLLSNGVKFTHLGKVMVEVAADGPGSLRFCVRDTGPGMPPASVEDLFRPVRAHGDGTAAQEQRRAGLGLLLARRLVDRMGGTFWIESAEGQGSTFTFTMPAPTTERASTRAVTPSVRLTVPPPDSALPFSRRDPASAVRSTEGSPLSARDPHVAASSRRFLDAPPEMKWGVPTPPIDSDEPRRRLEGLRVLLAEDNPVNRDVLLRWLGRLGARTHVAGTGYEVLIALDAATYDVIIMDVQMPDMDGIEAARRVRERSGRQPRIIAVTANTLPGMRDRCFAAGMDDYLPKPVHLETLGILLERALALPLADLAAGLAPPDDAPTEEASTGTLDETRLGSMRKLFEDPEGFAELVDQQISDAARLVEQMRAALSDKEFPALERSAHSLKATSAMFGAMRLSAACAALEEAATSGAEADMRRMLTRIEEEESTSRAALLRRVYENLLKEVSACA